MMMMTEMLGDADVDPSTFEHLFTVVAVLYIFTTNAESLST